MPDDPHAMNLTAWDIESPVVAGGRVYVGSSDGHLYGLDAASGKKVWEYEIGAAITASPTIASGRLVISAQDGRVYVFG